MKSLKIENQHLFEKLKEAEGAAIEFQNKSKRLEQYIHGLDTEKFRNEDNIRKLKGENENLRNEIVSKVKEMENLKEREINILKSQIENRSQECKEIVNEKIEQMHDLERINEENTLRIMELENQVNLNNSILKGSKNEVTAFEEENLILRKTLEEYRENFVKLKEKISSFEIEVEDLKKIEAAQADHIQNLEEELIGQKNRFDEWSKNNDCIDNLKSQIQTLEKEIEDERKRNESLITAELEFRENNANLANALKEENEKLLKMQNESNEKMISFQNERNENQEKSLKNYEREILTLIAKNKLECLKNEVLTIAFNSLENKFASEKSQLQKDKIELKRELVLLLAKKELANLEVEVLTSNFINFENKLKLQLKVFEDENMNLSNHLSQLKNDLNAVKTRFENLQIENKVNIEKFKSKISILEIENNNLKTRESNIQKENEGLKFEFQHAHNAKLSLISKVESLENEKSLLLSQIQELEYKENENQTILHSLKSQNSNLNNDLASAITSHEKIHLLESQIEELNTQKKQFSVKLEKSCERESELMNEVSNITNDLKESINKCERFEKELKSQNKELKKLRAYCNSSFKLIDFLSVHEKEILEISKKFESNLNVQLSNLSGKLIKAERGLQNLQSNFPNLLELQTFSRELIRILKIERKNKKLDNSDFSFILKETKKFVKSVEEEKEKYKVSKDQENSKGKTPEKFSKSSNEFLEIKPEAGFKVDNFEMSSVSNSYLEHEEQLSSRIEQGQQELLKNKQMLGDIINLIVDFGDPDLLEKISAILSIPK